MTGEMEPVLTAGRFWWRKVRRRLTCRRSYNLTENAMQQMLMPEDHVSWVSALDPGLSF
jgi:hypothetical protein